MFDVAGRASWGEGLLDLMDRRIVAGLACGLGHFGPEAAGGDVAGRAIVRENGVALCQGSCVERALFTSERSPAQPGDPYAHSDNA